MEYLFAAHLHSGAALLLFAAQFFISSLLTELLAAARNTFRLPNIVERGLSERTIYVQKLIREPDHFVANKQLLT